jgi:hypothetical protein
MLAVILANFVLSAALRYASVMPAVHIHISMAMKRESNSVGNRPDRKNEKRHEEKEPMKYEAKTNSQAT